MANTDYYLQKITSQYQDSPNLLAWLSANLQLYQDLLACIAQLETAFDINTAVGAQLDVLGQIIGASRTVGFQPSAGVSPVLDDDTYRLLLRSKIAQNHWDGKLDSLLLIWQYLFPGGLLIVNDHQTMTVDLYVAASLTSILQDLILQGYIIPRPQGVLYNISIATLPMFGFDRNDSFVSGPDVGHFV
jgi:hypothetical protein